MIKYFTSIIIVYAILIFSFSFTNLEGNVKYSHNPLVENKLEEVDHANGYIILKGSIGKYLTGSTPAYISKNNYKNKAPQLAVLNFFYNRTAGSTFYTNSIRRLLFDET